MRKITFALLLLSGLLGFTEAMAQSPGDTIVVQSLNFQSGTRDTIVHFPTAPTSYHKVYMQYSLRCKNAQVSTGTNRNLGCGEWDYSCNTYLHDSTHVDSITNTTPEYTISGYSGNTFSYLSTPTYDFHQSFQKNVTVTGTPTDTSAPVGSGSLSLNNVLPTDTFAAKTQYLFTASELSAAGAHAGNIDALTLNVASNPGQAKFFRIRLKATTATALSDTDPEFTGFTEVYFHQTQFTTGANKLYFATPFNWNGTSNIIVETSFTNTSNGSAITFSGTAGGSGLVSKGDHDFNFDGSNYIEANTYKGILGNANRTVEAWVKTTLAGSAIVSWGTNATGQKWLVRLDGSGALRAEVAGGNRIGTTPINDGQWHHVAVVLDGNNTNNLDLYVDGQLETNSSTNAIAINTTSGANFQVTRGPHNNYIDGTISEVRIWNKALTATEIQDWRFKTLTSSHPSYANLELYYPLNSGSGSTIIDASPNGNDASTINGTIWTPTNGVDHFKNLQSITDRPNTIFHQGQYNITIVTDTILDSVARQQHIVNHYGIFSNTGTVESDSIGLLSSNTYWDASPQNVYDPSGTQVSTIPVTADGTITLNDLPYWERSPSKFEIMSFVTPYGIGLDFGQEGKTWTFDMTDFMPILKGQKRMTIERGGQWQEEMDIKFLFVVGTPVREVLDIQQIWRVDYPFYADIANDRYYDPRDVMLNPNGETFVIKSAITGHGQEGEFIPQNHWLNIGGGSADFNWQVWKECAINPIFPQGGTWIYDRAGWCPGEATDIQTSDITSMVTAGQTANIDYGITSTQGTSRYIVSHQLVTYGQDNFTQDAAIIDIISPTRTPEHGRKDAICEGVKVLIQNTGTTDLTSLSFDYWVNNAPTPQTFSWNGNLAYLETEEVTLPGSYDLWNYLSGGADNTMHVEVSAPNGGADDYAFNNKMTTEFDIPEFMPADFLIMFTTNSTGNQNSYTLTDQSGNVVLSRNNLAASSSYIDTVHLALGCYNFRLEDTGDNGISFWANNEGSGSLRFRNISNPVPLKTFNGDFGRFINYNFTVSTPLALEDEEAANGIELYPNPAVGSFTIQMEDVKDAEINIFNNVGQRMELSAKAEGNKAVYNTSSLSKGVYFVHVKEKSNKVTIKKLVVL
ncbi:LamG-like jellyroll fold domain-containing protein [Owenweeksia hongkongensis]|uniref:LamG-like jellyroll fold domain-containing protein n=1 Tax=Owenweeksia hongkongensis TaxID=253245 RepID=UPI003A94A11E